MADLASKHELLTSFVAGLSDFLQTLVPSGEKPMRPLCFESAGAAFTGTFKADRDYFVVGWEHPNGYNVALSTNGRASAPLGAGTGRVSDGIFWLSTTASQAHPGKVRVPLPKDTTLTVWIGAAAGAVVVYLQEA